MYIYIYLHTYIHILKNTHTQIKIRAIDSQHGNFTQCKVSHLVGKTNVLTGSVKVTLFYITNRTLSTQQCLISIGFT